MRRRLVMTDNLEARKVGFPIRRMLGWLLSVLATSLVLALLCYFVFSLFFKTAEQRALEQENALYEKVYDQMLDQETLVRDVLDELGVRDENIYREIFHTEAPAIDILSSYSVRQVPDDLTYTQLIGYEDTRLGSVSARFEQSCANIQRALDVLNAPGHVIPPVGIPVDGLSYPQVGASIGEKMNPYYKVPTQHNGLDIISQQGSIVRATASGVVKEIINSKKGDGNVVILEHDGGYRTKYAHLEDINVSRGQRVSRGSKIGTVGVSGTTYAPHLHYEISLGGESLDPVGFFLTGVSLTDYANMLYMASRTQQSLD